MLDLSTVRAPESRSVHRLSLWCAPYSPAPRCAPAKPAPPLLALQPRAPVAHSLTRCPFCAPFNPMPCLHALQFRASIARQYRNMSEPKSPMAKSVWRVLNCFIPSLYRLISTVIYHYRYSVQLQVIWNFISGRIYAMAKQLRPNYSSPVCIIQFFHSLIQIRRMLT